MTAENSRTNNHGRLEHYKGRHFCGESQFHASVLIHTLRVLKMSINRGWGFF